VVNLHLFQELAAYPDVHVDLVTSSRTRSDYEYEEFSSRIRIHKVPVDNRNIHHATNPELLRYAVRGFRKAQQLARTHRFDVSFAFAGVPAGAMSLALWKLYSLPSVVSLQGPDVPGFEARYDRLYPLLAPVLRRVWRDARSVIAISNAHRALAAAFMPEVPIRIIHNGVDLRAFGTVRGGRRDGPVRILCSGRLIERKGQHHLLDALARLCHDGGREVHLVLAGTGDMEGALREQCRRLGLTDRVKFLGYVTRERMPEVYANADLFVLPSQSEGMSMALLEAMAAGLPVIVTETGGSEELVTDRVSGRIVQWADVDGLYAAMRDCLLDPSLLQAMGAVSHARAVRFSWSTITREYLDLLEGVIASSRSPERIA
jgi:glycosyltransferase involved in cell wall biosynthesis